MKNLLRSVAGAFVELEPLPEAAAPTPQATQPQANAGGFQVGTIATFGATSAAPKTHYAPAISQEMIDQLTNVSLNRKTAYTTFIEASKKLEQFIPDETTRVKAAFAQVDGDGRSLNQILQAIDVHISDVESEKGRFNQASEQSQRTLVDANVAKAQSLLKENDELARQIASLQDQIAALTTRGQENSSTAQTLTFQAEEDGRKIVAVKEDFFKAAAFVQQHLTDRKQMLASMITK